MVPAMTEEWAVTESAPAEPSHVPSGAVLLALELGRIARGVKGLDVLSRRVDRAPPRVV